MFTKIKALFTNKENTLDDVIQQPIEEPVTKCISDPIYLLVEKLKANPKMIVIGSTENTDHVNRTIFTIPLLGIDGYVQTYPIFSMKPTIKLNGIELTRDEKSYIGREVCQPFLERYNKYKDLYYARSRRYRLKREQTKRAEIQKKLEEM